MLEKSLGQEKLSAEIENFLNKHDKVVLMACGTVFSHSNTTMRAIFEHIKEDKKYGYIIGLKHKHKYDPHIFDIIANATNVLILPWIPQIQLLQHPKTKVFISHGGTNSVTESVYSKVPMIIIPNAALD